MKTNNQPRILAMDIGRGLSVLCMICVHTLWMYANKSVQADSWLGDAIHMIGKGTAAFLILMGFSFALSRRQSIHLAIKRGLVILLLGYLMNGLKFVLPIAVFGTMPDDFIQAYGWQSPLNFSQYQYLFLTGDILQMAGIATIFMGLIHHFIKNKYHVLIIAFAIALSAKLLSGYRVGVDGLDYLFDLLWGKEFNVYFPLFPWMSCILFGLFFGKWYQQTSQDKELVFRRMLQFGIIFIALGGGLMIMDYAYHFGDFFHLGAGGVIYLSGLNLVALWLIDKIINRLKSNRCYNLLTFASRNVTSLYIIQWTLICWGMGLIGYQQLNQTQTLLMIPLMISCTFAIEYLRHRLFNKSIWSNIMINLKFQKGTH